MTLGEPDAVRIEERFFAYAWTDTIGYLVAAGMYAGGIAPIHRSRAVLFEFDAEGVLARVERSTEYAGARPADMLDDWLEEDGHPPRSFGGWNEPAMVLAPELPATLPPNAPLTLVAPLRIHVSELELPLTRTRYLGRRTALGVHTHDILLANKTLNTLVRSACRNAFELAGHTADDAAPQIRVTVEACTLGLTTPSTLLTWNAECELEIVLLVERPNRPAAGTLRSTYSTTALRKTALGPNVKSLTSVLEACFESLTRQITSDENLCRWLARTGA